jgi:hypothetical protein
MSIEINFGEYIEGLAESHAIGYEARCDKCGETFNPSGEELVEIDDDGTVRVEHYQQFGPNAAGEYETECGGFGPMLGSWA